MCCSPAALAGVHRFASTYLMANRRANRLAVHHAHGRTPISSFDAMKREWRVARSKSEIRIPDRNQNRLNIYLLLAGIQQSRQTPPAFSRGRFPNIPESGFFSKSSTQTPRQRFSFPAYALIGNAKEYRGLLNSKRK